MLAALATASPAGAAAARAVKLVAPPGSPAASAHLAFAAGQGFDTVFVYSGEVGRYAEGAGKVRLLPGFRALRRELRAHGLRSIVSLNPIADSGGRIVFSDPETSERIVRFLRLLHRRGVDEAVLSFDDQPVQLAELSDIVRYGPTTARAQIDLVARVARARPRGMRLWFLPSAYCDAHLGDGTGPYVSALLAGMGALPADVGIAWTGPRVLSPAITAQDAARARERFGGRALFLYDNFPVNDNAGDALALVLAPLRGRDPALPGLVDVYLSCPMTELAASRLALLTVADWLRDPAGYDPDRSAERAVLRLAGGDPAAAEALRTQVLEWGGPIGGRNWTHSTVDNTETAAQAVGDPAALSRWGYVRDRYPERIAALEGLADAAFGEEVRERMRDRLAVARILPAAAVLSGGPTAPPGDPAAARAELAAIRAEYARSSPRRRALIDEVLEMAGVAPP